MFRNPRGIQVFSVMSTVYSIRVVSSNESQDSETSRVNNFMRSLYLTERNRRSYSYSVFPITNFMRSMYLMANNRRSNRFCKGLHFSILLYSRKTFPDVRFRNEKARKRILITGGAGFVGSHLVDRLMMDGHEVLIFYVIALDNYFTGRKRNVEHWIGHPNFELVHHDLVNPYFIEVDQIYHLASPASPPHYMYNPVKTIKTNILGTINMLVFGRVKATVLLASTSEVYGDPEVHPQPETYWGHVNTIGPRSCYDEGKRVAESLMVAYNKQEHVSIRIARIFNTFGPRMHLSDGRVVSNFIIQALQDSPITVRFTSFLSFFQRFLSLFDILVLCSSSEIVNHGSQEDDPQQRKPDISRAANELNWRPQVANTFLHNFFYTTHLSHQLCGSQHFSNSIGFLASIIHEGITTSYLWIRLMLEDFSFHCDCRSLLIESTLLGVLR
ncbi:unnamed protein product [Angiostrongylus costaricensis]|uniref:UDP-glucuronic acid decarboxylase 1 n=1 Tax=Angiostrongylus costaricensis TaxID=334426 RepID=A0A0R3PSZ0_ANGCS|nr:unnamed protein product [Angiostrongylus costaricensis]